MSLDYPNREVWLAKRSAPKRPVKFFHVSKPLVIVPLPTPHYEVSRACGVTYYANRNKAKRAKAAMRSQWSGK